MTPALAGAVLAFAAPVFSVIANPLVEIIAGDIGQGRPSGCPSRWCACYLEKALEEAGLPANGSNIAREYDDYGVAAAPGTVGSIMVMRSHVGVVTGTCEDGRVQILSGNHGRKVGAGCYSSSKAIAWRMPPAQPVEKVVVKRRTLSDILAGS